MKAAIRQRIPKPVIIRVGPEIKRTNIGGVGAGRYIAVLEPSDTDYHAEFRAVCDTLSYRERKALARALGVSFFTVVAWQKHRNYPGDFSMVAKVIAWGKADKPIIRQMPPPPCPLYIRQARALARAKENRALSGKAPVGRAPGPSDLIITIDHPSRARTAIT